MIEKIIQGVEFETLTNLILKKKKNRNNKNN